MSELPNLKKSSKVITPNNLTCNMIDAGKEKILFINSNKLFDSFTCMYGYLDLDNTIKIKWNNVAQDFCGLGVSGNIDRFSTMYFYGKEYESWIKNYPLERFLIFSNNKISESSSETEESSSEDSKSETETEESSSEKSKLKKSEESSSEELMVETKKSQESEESSSEELMVETKKSQESGKESPSSESETDHWQVNTTPNIRGKIRYFKVIDPQTGLDSGRFTGITPKQAASKALTSFVQKSKANGQNLDKTTLYISESTRGCNRKVFSYEAQRTKLDQPQVRTIKDPVTGNSRNISYLYRNTVRKIPCPETLANNTIQDSSSSSD